MMNSRYVTIMEVEIPRTTALYLIAAGLLFAGFIDDISGIELRVYPLYFLPLSLAAWRFGITGAISGSILATAIWLVSNWAAGLNYSQTHIWIFNAFFQLWAFGTVAALICWARLLLEREQVNARTDTLTGLANGRAFFEAVTHVAAGCRRQKRPLTLAYLDLDNFKCVNDRHGHARGDELLRTVADILRSDLRKSDLIARIGGDEFVVCLPETTAAQATALLERLLLNFALKLPESDCLVSASIGALSWKVPPGNIDEMISAADSVMYDVKKSGKNRVVVVDAPRHEHMQA